MKSPKNDTTKNAITTSTNNYASWSQPGGNVNPVWLQDLKARIGRHVNNSEGMLNVTVAVNETAVQLGEILLEQLHSSRLGSPHALRTLLDTSGKLQDWFEEDVLHRNHSLQEEVKTRLHFSQTMLQGYSALLDDLQQEAWQNGRPEVRTQGAELMIGHVMRLSARLACLGQKDKHQLPITVNSGTFSTLLLKSRHLLTSAMVLPSRLPSGFRFPPTDDSVEGTEFDRLWLEFPHGLDVTSTMHSPNWNQESPASQKAWGADFCNVENKEPKAATAYNAKAINATVSSNKSSLITTSGTSDNMIDKKTTTASSSSTTHTKYHQPAVGVIITRLSQHLISRKSRATLENKSKDNGKLSQPSLDQLLIKEQALVGSPIIVFSLDASPNHSRPLAQPVRMTVGHDFPLTAGQQPICAFWNAKTGNWDTEGCRRVSGTRSRSICECNHLTSFAVLIDLRGVQQQKLSTWWQRISAICSALSIIGLFVTAAIFLGIRRLRNRRNLITAHLCICLIIVNLLVSFALETRSKVRRGRENTITRN